MSNLIEPSSGKTVERSYVASSGNKKHIFAPQVNPEVGDVSKMIEGQKYFFEYRVHNQTDSGIGMFYFATERTLIFFREDDPTLTIGVPISNIKYLVAVSTTNK